MAERDEWIDAHRTPCGKPGCRKSDGYQEALRVLGDGADRDLRIVDGVA